MKNYILLIFSLFITISTHASWYPPVENYSNKSSLVSKQNWSIAQGANGWLYFANNRGLLEYNGIGWSIRQLDNNSIVRSVRCVDGERIYVGGSGEIGYFAADEMGRLTYHNLTQQMDETIAHFNEVWNIHAINEQLYFQLRRDMLVMDQDGSFSKIDSDGLIVASCVVNNSIYYLTNSGLHVIVEGESIAIKLEQEFFVGSEISAISSFGENTLIIATNFDGLYLYNKGQITPFHTDHDAILRKSQIYSIAVGKDKIACGTVRGGVIVMDRDGQNAERLDISSGLDNNTVLSVMFDRNDNLWCGLDNGIDCIEINSPLRHSQTNRELRHSGYTSLLDRSYLYLGTNQGLLRLKNAMHRGAEHHVDTEEEVLMIDGSEGQVWNLQKIDEKLFCSHHRGIFEMHEQSGRDPYLSPIYTEDGVWSIDRISSTRAIVGTYDGVVLLERQGEKYLATKISGCDGSVRDMLFIAPLRMGFYISELGLERLIFDEGYRSAKRVRLLENSAYEIKLLELDGQIVVYSPQGVYHINDDGTIQATTQYDKLFDRGATYSMISVDEYKNIWYVENNSLSILRYNKLLDLYDGSREVLFTNDNFFIPGFTRVLSLDKDRHIINNINGFSEVDSRWRKPAPMDIKPLIVSIYNTMNRDSLLFSNAYGVSKDRITLPYDQNSIQFTYSCNAVDRRSVEFSYRLIGSDLDWSAWSMFGDEMSQSGGGNRKEYTQLYEGDYIFQIQTKDDNGQINVTTLDIVISPPWHRSKSMYTLYTLLVISIIWFIIYRVRMVNADRRRLIILQSKRQMEQQKRQFESRAMEQVNNIIKLENEKLESEVKSKSAELSALLLNKLEKNDIITSTKADLDKIRIEVVNRQYDNLLKRISILNHRLDDKMIDNIDWGAFEDNFNITHNNFMQRLSEQYSWMTNNERKLCVYIKLGLQNKEISPLLNLSVRGVEMLRYRVRKKMGLDRNENLYEFFQRLSE